MVNKIQYIATIQLAGMNRLTRFPLSLSSYYVAKPQPRERAWQNQQSIQRKLHPHIQIYPLQAATSIYHKAQNFDELGVRKNLTSKILTNCISLTCKQYWKKNLNGKTDELLKIRQYFPLSKFCAVRCDMTAAL